METSKFLRINLTDIVQGVVLAAVSAAIEPVIEYVAQGKFSVDWRHVGTVALCAGLSYIKIKFFTSAQVVTPAQKP